MILAIKPSVEWDDVEMKIVTIVGARPQFIKAAVVSRLIREKHTEILVHTGQHYDENMSDVFFSEMNIPKPDYNLGITAATHGEMTGKMIIEIEKVLIAEKPDLVLVYGDTNSTLAGAISAVKLHIPICHVESGGRVGTKENPEEVNRIITDHVSSLLLCCTESAVEFLSKEGITKNVYLVGDPMYDAFCYYREIIKDMNIDTVELLSGDVTSIPRQYYYMTCHREENTNDDAPLLEILTCMNELKYPTVYPVHPRNAERVLRLNREYQFSNIIFCKPVGYLISVYLIVHAEKIVTDSGGLQREAFFARKQCVTVLDFIAWPETMIGNWNVLAKPDRLDLEMKLSLPQTEIPDGNPFGDGHAGDKIVITMDKYYEGICDEPKN